jgi:hypothetical protein
MENGTVAAIIALSTGLIVHVDSNIIRRKAFDHTELFFIWSNSFLQVVIIHGTCL